MNKEDLKAKHSPFRAILHFFGSFQKREEKKAKIEAEQAAKNQEVQRKAEEKQRKAAEASRLEELKSKEKKKQAQVMAKFFLQSENPKPADNDGQLVSLESQTDNLVKVSFENSRQSSVFAYKSK